MGEAELKESAEYIFDWLSKGMESNLRSLIVVLSAGGVFYSTDAMDKTTRAWLGRAAPWPTKADVHRALKARHTTTGSSAATGGGGDKPSEGFFAEA